jgi:hypothetical protein
MARVWWFSSNLQQILGTTLRKSPQIQWLATCGGTYYGTGFGVLRNVPGLTEFGGPIDQDYI